MTLTWWMILTVPVMAAFLLLYFFSKRCGEPRWGLIAKCGGSYVALMTALAGEHLGGRNPFFHPAVWGLLLCVAADALLEIRFPAGVACFGLAHVFFIVWLVGEAPLSPWSIAVFAPLFLLQFFYFRRDLSNISGNKPVYYLYPVVLIGMAAVAAVLPFTAGMGYTCAALGALVFVGSDFLVAKGFLRRNTKLEGAIIMISYYLALYLIASSVWAGA